MGRIGRLPPDLANQIAAGEVVERPASVVKELIENAIDAGATRITITTEQGGKRLIRVEDDGDGMDRADAELAVERHATSKIAHADDLAAIVTLGFRGEALPSIASVSRFVLRSRTRGQVAGTEVRLDGGQGLSVREIGVPEGTSIEVSDLFFNLPARRKFLKADAAESAQVSRVVTQMALAYPEVGFALLSGGRRVIDWPPVAARADRVYQVYGERPDLVPVRWDGPTIAVSGFVAALAEQGPTRGPQHLYVNRRVVKDRTVAHAILDAYASASMKERSPETHLFLDLPPDQVDVNVHPTKAEVRFREPSLIHGVVRRAVAAALGSGPAPELRLSAPLRSLPSAVPQALPGLLGEMARSWLSGSGGSWTTASGSTPAARGEAAASAWPSGGARDLREPGGAVGNGGEQGGDGGGGAGLAAGPVEPSVLPMIPLGQFRQTYIIAVDAEGISIIDQHVAHERVLFEQVMERLAAGRVESQRLLDGLVIALPPGQREALAAHAVELDRLGFETDVFGGDSIRVTAVPAWLGRDEAMAVVRAVAADLDGLSPRSPIDAVRRRIAATSACHAAVKANMPLSLEKMAYILDELRRTAHSSVCPHGRPVVLRLTRREIEKNFQRI